MRIQLCLLAAMAALPFPAGAQTAVTSSAVSATGAAMHGTMRMSARRFAGTPITGAPYSAQRVTEHVQTSADGTRFTTNTQQETLYRDSQGRTRTERPLMMGPNAPDAPLLIEISDPVANVGYTLDTQNKVAHRVAYDAPPSRFGGAAVGGGGGGVWREGSMGATLPPPGGGTSTGLARNVSGSARPHPEVADEDLGIRSIEGVMAGGHRFTQTWPTGSQGNDRPFQTTSETWFSPDLKLTVLSKNSDPRSGENTMKLIHIDRSEPPADLFQPPPDYKIVDETGPFEIQWTGTPRQ